MIVPPGLTAHTDIQCARTCVLRARRRLVSCVLNALVLERGQYFRMTPITTPWTCTWCAGTTMGSMVGLAGCRRIWPFSR
jgi:hypothetical protein